MGAPNFLSENTTIRSWLSVFSKFWRHCKYKDLKALVPTLEDKIGKWENKQTEVKQAKCFSREELTTFFERPASSRELQMKELSLRTPCQVSCQQWLAFQ